MNALLPRAGRRLLVCLLLIISALLISRPTAAQENSSAKGKELYDQIKTFAVTGGTAEAKGLVLKRDRVSMSFDGTFYFTASVEGHVTGAVFIGAGKFSAEVPPSQFEKDNLHRLLGTDILESDFKTAVLRFSDDTFDFIGTGRKEGVEGVDRAQKLATEMESRILKETGANLSARVALSILNAEKPGFFFANFDGGKRGRFSYILDYQNRLPVANFDINGGEKGLIFSHKSAESFNEIWLAFYGLEDYQRGQVSYSDVNDLVDITKYDMDVDLRNKKRLGLRATVTMKLLASHLRALPFKIGEDLGEEEDQRLKKQMRLKSVRAGGVEIAAVQEDWEGGFTVFLPETVSEGQQLELIFALDGEFLHGNMSGSCHYPLSNDSWFPRHGYLDRAAFDMTFRNAKEYRIAAVGVRLSEEPEPEDKNTLVTKYRMEYPVALATFALGPWERHKDLIKWEKGGDPTPLEFSSLPGSDAAIKEDFIMAELSNAVRYFSVMFGKYPYPVFGGAFHPFGFGQGFPTLLMIPAADRANKYTYVFIAHETGHQWWGNIVAWRSYRDVWLSEGFAEYSGILYTGARDGVKSRDELLSRLRDSLKLPPVTVDGLGKGKLVDVGPLVLGHRLLTTKTANAYTTPYLQQRCVGAADAPLSAERSQHRFRQGILCDDVRLRRSLSRQSCFDG